MPLAKETADECTRAVIGIIEFIFPSPPQPLQPDHTLAEGGLDSLDTLQVMIALEDRWPEIDLTDYEPNLRTTIRDVGTEIAKRLAA